LGKCLAFLEAAGLVQETFFKSSTTRKRSETMPALAMAERSSSPRPFFRWSPLTKTIKNISPLVRWSSQWVSQNGKDSAAKNEPKIGALDLK